ncbi:hypothetical protein B9G55_08820 [Saccharibacillus sp. O16]|nr:hypothetical protein B9G55_08820 [Saccharibacillus sp. O16]
MNKSRAPKTKPRATRTKPRTTRTASRTDNSKHRLRQAKSQDSSSRSPHSADPVHPLDSSRPISTNLPKKPSRWLAPLLTVGVIAAGVLTGLGLPTLSTNADPSRAVHHSNSVSSSSPLAASGSHTFTSGGNTAKETGASSTSAFSPSDSAPPSAPNASTPASKPAPSGSFVTVGSPVKADPAPQYLDIQQMHFLSATTGWMIQNQDGSEKVKQPLKLITTQDGGRHWSEQSMPGQLATGLGLASAKEGWAILYDRNKATDFTQNSVYARVQIVHTTDGGRSWQSQWSQASTYTDSFPASSNLVVTGKNSAYAIIEGKLLILRGSSWSQAAFGQKNFTAQHLSFTDARSGWVSGIMPPKEGAVDAYDVVVLHTSDGGRTWSKQLAAGGTDENSDTNTLNSRALDFADNKNGYLLTDDLSMMAGDLYRTRDGGAHWSKVQSKLRSHRPTLTDMDFADAQNGWISAALGAGPVEGGLMTTRDGGQSFEQTTGAGYDVGFIQLLNKENGYAVGATSMNRDYLLRTQDGGKSWSQLYPSLSPTEGLSFVDEKHGFGIGTVTRENRLLTTEDGGRSWTPGYAFGESRRVFAVDFLNAKEGWVAAYPIDKEIPAGEDVGPLSLELLHTTDGGRTFTILNWTSERGEDTDSLDDAVMHFTDSLHGTLLYSSALQVNVLRTSDGGKSWTYSEHSPQKDAYLYALNDRGELLSFSSSLKKQKQPVEFFRKSLDAPSWSLAGRWAKSGVSPIDATFADADHGYLLVDIVGDTLDTLSNPQLLTTTDGGTSWTVHAMPKNLNLDSYDAKLEFLDAKRGWLLTPRHLLATQDGGLSWKLVQQTDAAN